MTAARSVMIFKALLLDLLEPDPARQSSSSLSPTT